MSWRVADPQIPYFVVVILEQAKRNTDLARNLRLFVTRVHAELVSIELALQLLTQELVKATDAEVQKVLSRVADPIADKLTRLEGLINRIGKSARALAAQTSDRVDELGEAVLHKIWPGRLDLARDRFDVLLRQAMRRLGDDLAYRRSIWPFKFKRDPNVFISYRRADTGALAQDMEAELQSRLPKGHVFRDAASIASGTEWRPEVLAAVLRADIVIVLLGNDWAGPVTVLGRRIDDPDDVFRNEIETALLHGKRVVPVVKAGASMPSINDLPVELRGLTEFQAYHLDDSSLPDLAAAIVS